MRSRLVVACVHILRKMVTNADVYQKLSENLGVKVGEGAHSKGTYVLA